MNKSFTFSRPAFMRITLYTFLLFLFLPGDASAQWIKQFDGVWYQNTGGVFDPWTKLSDRYDADDMAELAPVLERIRDETGDQVVSNIFSGTSCGKSASTVINTVKDDLLPLGWDLDQMNSVDPTNFISDNGTIHTVPMFTSSKGNSYIVDRYTGFIEIRLMDHIENSNQVEPADGESSLLAGYYAVLGNGFQVFAPDNTNVHFKGEETCPVPEEGDEEETDVVTSMDPNDKLGLSGAGESNYLSSLIPMTYTIRFENADSASAPAQEVLILDDLDLSVYDVESLTLGDIGFGDRIVSVPAGKSTFNTTVDLRPDVDILLRIAAGVETTTGRLVWRFSSIDPDTGELPADPFEGFLPPNQTQPEGEGFVTFTINPKEDLPTGTVISNDARIYFDLNEPIDTPPWVNVVDKTAPQSSVVSLSPQRPDTTVVVSWQGSDNGAGIARYAVFVSENSGEFKPWIANTKETSAIFSPDPITRTQYSFYSIAYDAAGNIEGSKNVAEATTTVIVSVDEDIVSDLPVVYRMGQNYPNPLRETTTIDVDLPEATHVRLIVFDMLGRQVATLLDEEKSAGRYQIRWDVRGLASGSYLYRIETDAFKSTRTLTVTR